VRSVSLAVGERHELTLRGLGSAGYSWNLEVDGPEGVVAIERRPSGSPPPLGPGGRTPDTYSLPEVYEIEGLAPGRVQIRLTLRRSWETDVPPAEEDELEVVVTPAAEPSK
jgi:predicted secreted protein